jgi:hypothetical protein
VEDGPEATLYVNLDAPAVRALLAAPEGRADAAAAILGAFAQASGRREDGARDLATTLAALEQGLLALLA